MTEDSILQLPKRNNYHYNIEHVDDAECMVLYYRLSDNVWDRHIEYCKEHGFENEIEKWLRILVDVDDFEKIDGWSIGVNLIHLKRIKSTKSPYIRIQIVKIINKKQSNKSIHRHILNPPQDKQVDHINHNTLDNRKCNLRLVTASENKQNSNGCKSNSKTGIRGVSITILNKNTKYERQYYTAQVCLNGKCVFRKLFPFTPQGLIDTEKAVVEARQKYYTHSEMDKNGVGND